MVQLNMCVLAMEYPGYGYFIEKEQETSEECICANALHVFDFLTNELQINPSRPSVNPRRHLLAGQVHRVYSSHRLGHQTQSWVWWQDLQQHHFGMIQSGK